jgi:hypothetical protein
MWRPNTVIIIAYGLVSMTIGYLASMMMDRSH